MPKIDLYIHKLNSKFKKKGCIIFLTPNIFGKYIWVNAIKNLSNFVKHKTYHFLFYN